MPRSFYNKSKCQQGSADKLHTLKVFHVSVSDTVLEFSLLLRAQLAVHMRKFGCKQVIKKVTCCQRGMNVSLKHARVKTNVTTFFEEFVTDHY
jgi:hypothetical protein